MTDTIGKRIVHARGRLGWTQDDLSRHLEKDYQQVSAWERDKSVPRAKNLHRLASALGVRAAWLQLGQEPMMPSPLESLTASNIQSAVAENTVPYLDAQLPPLDRGLLLQVLDIVLAEAPPSSDRRALGTLILSAYDQAVEGKSLDQIREKVKMWFS